MTREVDASKESRWIELHLLFLICYLQTTIIFCKATNEACHSIDRILKKYALASGQLINHDKSTITFSHNASQERKEKLTNILGMRLEDHRDKYLGLPSIANERKKRYLQLLEIKSEKKNAWLEGGVLIPSW
ncbi:UNVERIFIED_CONTAM: hypothetical protein Sradi_7213800 [Sesamum radiatum]|uniref:Reverse transcriptase domain-containing protein n=1 Tax=Sesamum radiatum TaxID=300843 RepID=A0AAW2IP38_SESRA